MPSLPPGLTALLGDLGDEDAVARLLPHVCDELNVLARRHLSGQREGHTLDTSALVHEAYLHLAERGDGAYTDARTFSASRRSPRGAS